MEAVYYNDLSAAWTRAWAELTRAVTDRHHGFHVAQMATLGADGAPDIRSLILRAADGDNQLLRLHSDARSTKCVQLQAEPRAALQVYDAPGRLQLRIQGRVSLHASDVLANHAWQETHATSRVCYRVQPGPGSALGAPDGYAHAAPDGTGSDPGRECFRVLLLSADVVEWLYLAAEGHRRARWRRADGWRGEWLAP